MKVLRVWDDTRSQHLEFLPRMTPGLLLFHRKGYDFDESLLDPAIAQRKSIPATAWAILTGTYDILEVNEPTMAKLWPSLALYSAALRLNRLTRRLRGKSRPQVVFYAIDNFDMRAGLARKLPLPAGAAKLLFDAVYRYLMAPVDRIAFGTDGALAVYESYAPLTGIDTTIVHELDQVCDCGPLDEKDPNLVLFVGALDERKGIVPLMAAWPTLASLRPQLRLTIVGVGPLADRVSQWAADRDDVDFVPDPPRARIHELYRRARTTVLLSQPYGYWREQVGLPLTEGLAHGCLVTSSTESGIAEWLDEHGFLVLPPDIEPTDLAERLADYTDSQRPVSDIVAPLPRTYTRLTADAWLTR